MTDPAITLPMPAERPLHVISLHMTKSEPGQTTTTMQLSYRAGVSVEEALGSAILAAEKAKPGFFATQWLIYTFEEPAA